MTLCLEKAVHRLSLSANQGHPAAQNSLALAHCKGLGTPQNFSLGAFYYQQSADQYNTLGQYNSGVCFVYGTGVRKDDNEALKRFRQAASKGHVLARNAAKSLLVRKEQVGGWWVCFWLMIM
jgi:TPR repeat protein